MAYGEAENLSVAALPGSVGSAADARRSRRAPRGSKRAELQYETLNATSGGPLLERLMTSKSSVIAFQEHHRSDASSLDPLRRWAARSGFKLALTPANSSFPGGTNGGTGIAVKSNVGMVKLSSRFPSFVSDWILLGTDSRATVAHLSTRFSGGLVPLSL